MTFTLKEIYIANEKNRDANVKFVSLIKEADPLYKFKNKPVKSRKILINSNETSDESLKNKYKDFTNFTLVKENFLNYKISFLLLIVIYYCLFSFHLWFCLSSNLTECI
jgi:hypothetical protein